MDACPTATLCLFLQRWRVRTGRAALTLRAACATVYERLQRADARARRVRGDAERTLEEQRDMHFRDDAASAEGHGPLTFAGGLSVLLASGPPILAATSPGRRERIDVRRAVAPRVQAGMLGTRQSVAIGVELRLGDDGVPLRANPCDAHAPALEAAAMIAALQWRFSMNSAEGPAARQFMLLFAFESGAVDADDAPSVVFELPWNVYVRVPRAPRSLDLPGAS